MAKIIGGDPRKLGFDPVGEDEDGNPEYWIHVVTYGNGELDEDASIVYTLISTKEFLKEDLKKVRRKAFGLYYGAEDHRKYDSRGGLDLDVCASDRVFKGGLLNNGN